MSDFAPEIPAPAEVELHNFSLQKDNTFRLWLRFDDRSYMCLDIPPGSEAERRTHDFIAGIATEMLNRLGNRGIVITGVTEPEDEVEAGS